MTGPKPKLSVAVVATTAFSGGAEIYIDRLARGLVGGGAEVVLYGSIPPYSLPSVELDHGPKWSLRTLPLSVLHFGRDLATLRSRVSKRHNAFSLHFKREQVAFTRELSKHARVVWTEHGTFPSGPFGSLIGPLYRRASRHAAQIVCVSDVVRQSIIQHVADPSKVVVIESAVDDQAPVDRSEARARLGVSHDSRVCVFAGRLTSKKRPQLAIDAAIAARATILVAGEGPLFADLSRAYSSNPLVVFLGQVPSTRDLFAAADVHLWTSDGDGEGFPTVLLEAARAGTRTVGVTGTNFETMVIESGGRLAHPVADDIAQRIATDESSSEARRRRRWLDAHSYEAWLRSYRAVFLSVESERNRQG
ncbi:glycosyltransferase family 4 protein [Microbacterium sp. NPDC091382]|uniref:glycosyltransferase family 4 protein n=1 Tax=Microbacterium sp. NPDC091382 TaxID=3364210 RepID=UPI00380BEDD5